MRLLVTGAGGMLGQDVVRAARGHEVVALARRDLDVTDAAAVEAAIGDTAPHAVVNCAAWTDVDGAESDPQGAHAVNAAGPNHLARTCAAGGARLVHVSTDYVFDGERTPDSEPYVESDQTGPRSAYGASKLAGEQAVAAAGGSHAIVRSSWLFGDGGSNFVTTMLQLGAERSEVTVVDDQIGCPTATVQLARALVDLAGSPAQGIFHVAGGGRCSWYQLAVEVFRIAQRDCRVVPCTTADMPRPARRPAFSVLATERQGTPVLGPWQEGLAAYVSAMRPVGA
jgi:dTDP-4-dehydrorhamnose reductase